MHKGSNLIDFKQRRRERIASISSSIIEKTYRVIQENYPPHVIHVAWSEFMGSEALLQLDFDSPEFSTFMPWFHYCWEPDYEILDASGIYQIPQVSPVDYLLDQYLDLTEDEYGYAVRCSEESFSFYEILTVQRGRSLELYDLFRNKRITVLERRATEDACVGGIVYAMAIEMYNIGAMVGCSDIIFPDSVRPTILDFKKNLIGRKRKMSNQDLYELQYEILYFYRTLHDIMVK